MNILLFNGPTSISYIYIYIYIPIYIYTYIYTYISFEIYNPLVIPVMLIFVNFWIFKFQLLLHPKKKSCPYISNYFDKSFISYRSSRPKVFCRKNIFKSFTNFTVLIGFPNLVIRETQTQMWKNFFKFSKKFRHIFFIEHLGTVASVSFFKSSRIFN